MTDSEKKKRIQEAQKALAKKHKVHERFLILLENGVQALKHINDEAYMIYFNIMDPNHKFFKSTKTVKVGW